MLVLLAGCRPKSPEEIAARDEARRACRSQPIVLTPWNIEGTLVEENEYRHLVKSVSDEIGLGLQDRVAKLDKFERVVTAPDCTFGVRVESRVVSLIHKRRHYRFKIAGRVVECGTEKLLHTFEREEENKEITEIAGRLADRITGEIEDVVCSRAAGGDEVLPPPPPPPAPAPEAAAAP
jgi:hypothetical protein